MLLLEQRVARELINHYVSKKKEREKNARLILDRYGIVTALYNVIWSYIGYSNANYALSETKNPVKTLKRAAPAALILVSILYMLTNVSHQFLFQNPFANFFRSHTLPQYPKRISSAPVVSLLLLSSATCSVLALSVYYPYSSHSQHSEMS